MAAPVDQGLATPPATQYYVSRAAPEAAKPRVANQLWSGPIISVQDRRSGHSDYQQRVQTAWEGGRQLDHPLRRNRQTWKSTEAVPINSVGLRRNLERAAKDMWPVFHPKPQLESNPAPMCPLVPQHTPLAAPSGPVRAYDRSVPFTVGTSVRQPTAGGATVGGANLGQYTIPGVQNDAPGWDHPAVDIPGLTTHNFVRELPGSPRPAMRVLPQTFEVPTTTETVPNGE